MLDSARDHRHVQFTRLVYPFYIYSTKLHDTSGKVGGVEDRAH
jgi:hypothetical protein